MLLTTTAKKKTLFAVIRVYSRGIAGFTGQRTAFTRAQSATLRALKILIHEANIS